MDNIKLFIRSCLDLEVEVDIIVDKLVAECSLSQEEAKSLVLSCTNE